MDGPISNNSAKGVTGNRLPEHQRDRGPERRGPAREVQRRVRRRHRRRQGRPQDAQPPDPRRLRQGAGQGPEQGPGRRGHRRRQGERPGGRRALQAPSPTAPSASWPASPTSRPGSATRPKAIDLQFQVLKYQPTDLNKLLDQMAAVETRPARPGRYRNALRRRECCLKGSDRSRPTSKASSPSGRTRPPTCPPRSRRKSSAACRRRRPPAGTS